MTKKKSIVLSMLVFSLAVSLVIVFSGVLTPKSMFEGDYPYYPDVASITEASDVIVAGDVVTAKDVKDLMVDRTPNKKDKETTPYTVSTIRVTEVVKGNVKVGDILTIKQLGDYVNQPEATLHKIDGYLNKGSRQLMFLYEYADSPYSPISPAQGMIEVKDDNTLYSASKFSLFGYGKTTEKAGSADTLESSIAEIKACMK